MPQDKHRDEQTLDRTGIYSSRRGGSSSTTCLLTKSGAGMVHGLSRYSSDASVFQYSRQILNISVSSTSDISSRYASACTQAPRQQTP